MVNKMLSLKRPNISIQTLLIDFFSIVIGVLFALGIDEWRKNMEDENLVETVLN